MTWFKVDDQFHEHKKVRRLGRDKLPAAGLWSLCGSWAADTLSDGFVPEEIVMRHDPELHYAQRLVDVGLWVPTEQDGEQGYQFHDWDDHQPTKEEVEARRRADAQRRARWRAAKATDEQSYEPDFDGAAVEVPADAAWDAWQDQEGVSHRDVHRDPNRDVQRESHRDATPDSQQESRSGSVLPDPTRPGPTIERPSDVLFGSPEHPHELAPPPPPVELKPQKRATRIPPDWRVSARMVSWARERCPDVDGRTETEKFVNFWRGKGGKGATKLDWNRTWYNWMLSAQQRIDERRPKPSNVVAFRSTTDDRVAQALAAGAAVQAELDAQREANRDPA